MRHGRRWQLAAGLVNATQLLINREMRQQPSGGVDLNETDKSINITDRLRWRPVDEGTLFDEPTATGRTGGGRQGN